MGLFNSIFMRFQDSIIYYEWIFGVYHIPFCIVTLLLLFFLVRIDHNRKVYSESVGLFDKLWKDVFLLDDDNKKYLFPFFRLTKVVKPHSIISSQMNFEIMFKQFLSFVDTRRSFFLLKADLLYVYGAVREKILSFAEKSRSFYERRRFIRFRNIAPVFFFDRQDTPITDGLLINISGGGARFFTKKDLKKGQRINLFFDKKAMCCVTAKILEVIKKADFYIVRVKFPLVYPNM